MYNISLNTVLLAATATAAVIAIISSIKDPKKRNLTIVVFLTALIIMSIALKKNAVKPPVPEPKPAFTLAHIIDIKGLYKGHIMNAAGEKELMTLQVKKHYNRDSIKMVFINKKMITAYYAKYFFPEQLIILKNGDSAIVTKDDSFVSIKSIHKIYDSWEFEKPI